MGCILVDSEVIPLDLSALIIPIIFSTLNLISWKDALRSFMDPIIWIFMGGFVLARAFQIWHLDKRVAFRLSTIYKGKSPMLSAFLIVCLPVFSLQLLVQLLLQQPLCIQLYWHIYLLLVLLWVVDLLRQLCLLLVKLQLLVQCSY